MKVYPTPNTEEECKRLSSEKAVENGCDTGTQYWWEWAEDETGWHLIKDGDGVAESQARKEIVEGLILAATEFGLGNFVKRFFFDHRDVIFEYETNGGTGLYNLFETAIDSELDEMNADGQSPRVYALEMLG